MAKVSIVIPVFGVEKYIKRCAKSLFEQTLDDIEYIFVDDCTTDNSLTILNQVLQEYPNRIAQTIILHHEINKGLPKARRTGFMAATGEYIYHCDSDDWLDVTMCKKLYDNAIAKSADIVVCDFHRSDGFHDQLCLGCGNEDLNQFLKHVLSKKYSWSVWNKMIKRDVYCSTDVSNISSGVGEDMVLMTELMINCKRLSYVPEPLYYYFHNVNSMINSSSAEKVLQKYSQFCDNANLIDDYFKHHQDRGEYQIYIDAVKFSAKSFLAPILSQKEIFYLWKLTFKEINLRCLFNNVISYKEKIKYILSWLRIYPWRKY